MVIARPVALVAWLACASLSAADVTLSVDWHGGSAQTGNFAYSLNAFQAFDPTWPGSMGNATYRANVAAMAPGIVRYHHWGMLDQSTSDTSGNGWLVDPANRPDWNSVKIANAMHGAYNFGPVLMMNIPLWPGCLADSNGRLASDKTAAFAAYCADLVKIVNVDLGKQVRYWEVTNEQDGGSGYDGRMGDLAVIYNAAAIAMRAVDPTIKIGGPAFARPDIIANVDAFIAGAADQLDFVSYHTYSTGNGGASNASVWDSAAGLGWATTSMRAAINRVTTRPIETFHNEYNISWSPPDAKMTNAVSAIYDALAMTALVRAGVSGAMAWNEADGWYGKCENQWGDWAMRPAAHVFKVFNQHLRGRLATVTTTNAGQVELLAVAGGAKRALALINRAGAAQQVALSFSGWRSVPSQFYVYQIGSGGLSETTASYAGITGGYTLPLDTVTVLVAQDLPSLDSVRSRFGSTTGDGNFNSDADLSQDGRIDATDLGELTRTTGP